VRGINDLSVPAKVVCQVRMRKANPTSGFTPESISTRLETKQLGRNLIQLDECTSTNDLARRFASKNAPHGSLILSATQTEGQGRHGRRWISPRGGIWMTLVLRSITLPIDAIPLVGALSAARSVNGQLGIDARVRWPNDVVVHGSKVAGVIAEGRQQGNSLEFVLLGLGVNANFESIELYDTGIDAATLMDLNEGNPIDSSMLICNILLELEELFALERSNVTRFLDLLRSRDFSVGKKVKVVTKDRTIEGVFGDYSAVDSAVVEVNGELTIVSTPSAIFVEYPD